VDVVAHAGAVGRRVIAAKDRYALAALDGGQDVGDEVRLGLVELAQLVGRAGCVDVALRDV
jgi:hypothetical protein